MRLFPPQLNYNMFVTLNKLFLRIRLRFRFSTQTSQDLMPFVRKKLEAMSNDYTHLQRKFHEEGGASHKRRREQFQKLARFAALHQQLESAYKNIEDLQKMAQQDKDSQEFAKQEIERYKEELQAVKQTTIEQLKQPALYDEYQEIRMELRPAVGGAESSLFTQDVADMYQRYIASQGWSLSILEEQKDFSVKEGLKFICMKVVGEDCYKKMKCQSGVHKVIRVPETENKGRLHSSTMSVVVVPYIPFDYTINDKDIKYEFTRAQGAGGQHVNKTDSACRATHVPTGLSVFIQQQRVQDQNKRRATQILKQKLFQMQYQKNVEQQAKRRKVQIGTGDRSEKIRTYNFPQDRITDHRIGLTLYGIDKMLSGLYLEEFIKAYQQKIDRVQRQQAIAALKS